MFFFRLEPKKTTKIKAKTKTVKKSPPQGADLAKKLAQKRAAKILPERLDLLAARHGFKGYSLGKIGLRKTRWGSCTSNKAISLNLGLISLPQELIDYVIIHELCHTRHMNHSREFWAEVAKYDPKYKIHRAKLKSLQPKIQ